MNEFDRADADDLTPIYSDDSVKAYFAHIKMINNFTTEANHSLLCSKCRSNTWNNLKQTSPLRLKATCTKCNNVQVLIRARNETFVQESI